MPNSSFLVPFDTTVRSSDQTLQAVIEAVRSVNNGNHPGVGRQIRDSSGKVVEVRLTFPSTVAPAAVAAIKATPGVPNICANNPIPAQLVSGKLTAVNGITNTGAALVAGQAIYAQGSSNPVGGANLLGFLDDTGYHVGAGGNGYTLVEIYSGLSPLTLNSGELTLHFLDLRNVPLLFAVPFVLPGNYSYAALWVADSGACFVATRTTGGTVLSGPDQRDYDIATSCYDAI